MSSSDDIAWPANQQPPCERNRGSTMCNLYSVTTNQEAMRRLFKVRRDRTGNGKTLTPVEESLKPQTTACFGKPQLQLYSH